MTDLSRYFDKSATVVQDACTQFEKNYARPAYQNMRGYFEERPIISTFVTIFTLLSLVPIAFFAGTSLFVFTTFTLIALFTALFASLSIVLFCFGFLAVVLFGILLASLFLTGATIASYSLIRLALHVQREGASTGVSEWGRETRHSLLTTQPKPQNRILAVKEEEDTEGEELLNGDLKPHNGPTHSEPERAGRGGVEVRKPKEVSEKRAFSADHEYNERLIDETLSDQEDLHHRYFEHRQQQHPLPPPLPHQHQPQLPSSASSSSSSPHYIPISSTNTTRTTPPKSKLRPQQQQHQQLHQPLPQPQPSGTNKSLFCSLPPETSNTTSLVNPVCKPTTLLPYDLNFTGDNVNNDNSTPNLENTNMSTDKIDFGPCHSFSRSSSSCSRSQSKSDGGSGITFPSSKEAEAEPVGHRQVNPDPNLRGVEVDNDSGGGGGGGGSGGGSGTGAAAEEETEDELSLSAASAVLSYAVWCALYDWTTAAIIWIDPWSFLYA